MSQYILALDQGTTSSRAVLFDRGGRPVASAQQEFSQIFPRPAHVEHDPEAIWSSQLAVAREAMARARVSARDIAALGVTNQRETTLVWDRATGAPLANAIVWQSRVSSAICDRLRAGCLHDLIRAKTGLVIDPYFSATKLRYLLDTVPGLRARAERGEVCFGTVDSFLVWRLTGGRRHVTDVSNASRTMLFNIHTLEWDDELLRLLDIPRSMLPDIRSSSDVSGETEPSLFGSSIPIAGCAGDQQASLFGQACFGPGMAKNTYGTGCFLLLNTGAQPVASQRGLLTSIAWRRGGETTYCLEGSVFIAGAVVQWLRDGLGVLRKSSDIEALAASVPDGGGVYTVPAFCGLGAPYWDPYARGAIVGLTRETTMAHIARAALESIAYQSREILDLMQDEAGVRLSELKADGGAALNDLLLQFQADLIGVPVRRPVVAESTALGAAYLAGLAVGFWRDLDEIRRNWVLDREFVSSMPEGRREQLYRGWQKAVQRALGWAEPDAPEGVAPR